MREFRSYGSVRGALRNGRPYREHSDRKPRCFPSSIDAGHGAALMTIMG